MRRARVELSDFTRSEYQIVISENQSKSATQNIHPSKAVVDPLLQNLRVATTRKRSFIWLRRWVMRLRRLGWAGVELECDGETLVIDHVMNTASFADVIRGPDETFLPSSRPGATAVALVTHLHGDHADPVALAAALRAGAPFFRPEPATGNEDDLALTAYAEEMFVERKLATNVVRIWDERNVGPFRIFAAPAIDGSGDPQITWIIECGGRRVLHAGDTMFPDFWWRIAHRYAPFDVAFLPINVPVVRFPALRPTSELRP